MLSGILSKKRYRNLKYCDVKVTFAKLLTSEVNVIGELRGSRGNPGFGPDPRVQKFNLQTGQVM